MILCKLPLYLLLCSHSALSPGEAGISEEGVGEGVRVEGVPVKRRRWRYDEAAGGGTGLARAFRRLASVSSSVSSGSVDRSSSRK